MLDKNTDEKVNLRRKARQREVLVDVVMPLVIMFMQIINLIVMLALCHKCS